MSFKRFLQKITRRNQKAYIDLLVACRHTKHPFNQAHSKIAARLARVAPLHGFTKVKPGTEIDIFGNEFKSAVYTRIDTNV